MYAYDALGMVGAGLDIDKPERGRLSVIHRSETSQASEVFLETGHS
jgi:hypothetical protein